MNDENLLTRREFTVESALAMLAGVTITISGCGGDNNRHPESRERAIVRAWHVAGLVGQVG